MFPIFSFIILTSMSISFFIDIDVIRNFMFYIFLHFIRVVFVSGPFTFNLVILYSRVWVFLLIINFSFSIYNRSQTSIPLGPYDNYPYIKRYRYYLSSYFQGFLQFLFWWYTGPLGKRLMYVYSLFYLWTFI